MDQYLIQPPSEKYLPRANVNKFRYPKTKREREERETLKHTPLNEVVSIKSLSPEFREPMKWEIKGEWEPEGMKETSKTWPSKSTEQTP